MKSLAAAESAAIIHFLQFRIQWASIVLLYYDYALTFPAEVKYIWGKKFRFSTALYICCRYALIANVLYLAAIAGRIPHVKRYAWKHRSSIMVSHLSGYSLLAILMCVFEFLAAILTIARCIQECRVGGSWKMDRGSFLAVISKQGTTYYCIISVFTTAAVVLSFRAPTGSFFQRLPNAFNLPVSCLLTARFLLQLREWQSMDHVSADATASGVQTRQAQTLSTLQAVAVVDAALLDDFGDLSTQSSWETESTRAYDFTAENGKNNEIAMDSLGSTGQNTNIKENA
ncbi:hypothetical protein A7U60_g1840 [Sanghuangporus baumii]|uniref:DUF6533 domain-containing protein n=1 Tax=Sanghuangporus baumii TaxID=108892 RepID=A0A9Q5N8R6_SANBA|nr:hypothetical protein A7U60_g1840 [Sanghuangporus baumii]